MARFTRIALATVAAIGIGNAVAFGTSLGAPRQNSLSGVVYHDLNNNGVRNSGEPGIANIVINAGNRTTVTGPTGKWKLTAVRGSKVEVQTGWYRSQCNAPTCGTGPGVHQDFKVSYQNIQTNVRRKTSRLDLGLVPDWSGGYPVRAKASKANTIDVSVRLSYVTPTGTVGDSNCSRTTTVKNRACAIGDQPSFLLRIYNEGTSQIVNPAGHLVLPTGTQLVSFTGATANHPDLGRLALGAFDPATNSIPFSVAGTLPPAAVGLYDVTLLVTGDAPLTTTFQTRGSYPNPVGARITSVVGDAEGDKCTTIDGCRWGTTDRQAWPDNSDTAGFAVVAGEAVSTPATTIPVVTLPPKAAPPVTTPPITVPPVTIPPTTTPPTTAPPVTVPPTTAPPVTTPPTTTPPSSGCDVSALLVPSCGAWLGSSTPPSNGGGDVAVGLAEYEAVAQNTPDILHYYKTGAANFPTAKEISLSERPGKQRSLLMYNWKPSKTATWRQIANGAADSEIATVAANLKKYPNKLFLNIFHEPEDNVNTSASSGMTTADYADMYRYVVDKLKGHGVTNAVYVWNVMGYYGWADYLDGLYPGNSYVDWVCGDPYFKDDKKENMAELVDMPRQNLNWPGFYDWATNRAPGKPIMLCEWGVDLKTNSDPASILEGDVAQLMVDYPMLKGFVYWNSIDKVNARIDDPSTKGKELGAAYRTFANQPFFNSTSTSKAP